MLNRRLLRDHRLVQQLARKSSVLLFYAVHQLSAQQLHQLSLRYSASGFRGYLFSRRGQPSFGPRTHVAYRFLSSGGFYGLYWPQWSLGQQTGLPPAPFGLYHGHFFLQSPAALAAAAEAPAILCGSLQSVGHPLVQTLSLLPIQLTYLLSPPC